MIYNYIKVNQQSHHLLYSGGEFVRLYPVNPSQTSNYAAKTKKAAMRAYKPALDI